MRFSMAFASIPIFGRRPPAHCEMPDADDVDPSLWFPPHAIKTRANSASDASPVDVVADFDQHDDFVSIAAATIKMEIEGATTDDAHDLHDDALGFATMSVASPVSCDEPTAPLPTGDMDEVARRKQLSIERRRKRNREAMQRSRQRDKDYMEGLRQTAAHLETVHNELVEQMNQRLSLSSSDSHMSELQTQLEDARRQAHELMEQNLKFQEEITERIKGEDRMEGLLKELLKEQQKNAGALSAILYDHMAPHLTMDRAMEIIMMSRKRRQCIQKKRLTAKEHAYNFFGWDVRHYFQGKYLYMKFSKMFRNRTAEEISNRAWNHVRQMVSYRSTPAPRKVGQQLNDDTFISVVDKRDPDNMYEFVRVYNLRFRVKEPDGVIGIGTQTLPQSHLLDSALENVWASDVCMWIMMTPVQECDMATGELVEHCRVEFVGKTRYGAHQLAHQNALETVISLARWEETNVGTTQRLLATEWAD